MYRTIAALLFFGMLKSSVTFAGEYNLEIAHGVIDIDGEARDAMTINGGVPGPILHFKEGEDVVINVTNRLDETTSVHWHGLILPGEMDGVPGFNGFAGIAAGQTFTYRFKVQQSGTYWYHSHSGTQEQAGIYGSIVIDPANGEVVKADRDYVIVLSDNSAEDPDEVLRNLKNDPGYYNYGKRTVGDFFADASRDGFDAALKDRLDWGDMRMDPTDMADVTGYTFLVNGKSPGQNWTGLFKPGERVRLRFINASAMTFFDVSIPGLKMIVVAADGRNVMPVPVDEFRFGVAETYDVIVTPREDQAYTIAAEAIDRTGFAIGTLVPREGMRGVAPEPRPRAVLVMADMGMAHGGMDHSSGATAAPMDHAAMGHDMAGMQNMDHAAMGHDMPATAPGTAPAAPMDHAAMGHDMAGMQNMDHAAMGHDMAGMQGMNHAAMGHDMAGMADLSGPEMGGPPRGWAQASTPAGARSLSYGDLKSLTPQPDTRPPGREIAVSLDGNMERYIWTLNGTKTPQFDPIMLRQGERVKITFTNATMMAHPMHLHGMFMQLANGQPPERMPDKHTIIVPPGQSTTVLLSATEVGEWAFHCHLLYHMEAGMMGKVVVLPQTAAAQ